MANGRQYHMNTDSRQRWMDDVLRRVAAEQQRNPEGLSRDFGDPRFANRPMQPAPVPQESYTGWLGDVIGRVKDFRLPEGPNIPGARTPLNPSGTLGGGVNMLKDMLISTGEDFGAEGGHKDTPIPMGKLAAAGLLPLKGISKVAKSLIGGADEAAEAASRTRRMREAERSVAAAGQAEREALKEAGHYAELPGEARKARQTAAAAERDEILDLMGEAGLEDPNSVEAILREAYGSTPPKSSLDFEPQWADDLASAEPVAQVSKGTPGLRREDTLVDGRPRIKMSESTGHLVSDRPLLGMDPAARGTSPATPQIQPRQARTPIRMNPPDETLKANQKAYKDKIQRDTTQIGPGGKEFPPTTSVAKQEAMDRFSRLEFDMSPADSIFVTHGARVHPTVIKNAGREIVVVELKNGLRMPFYKRYGTGTEAQVGVHEAGDWKPFFGLKEADKVRNQSGLGRGWFMKHPSHESLHKGNPFERELHDIGKSLKNLFEQGNLKVDPRFDFDNQLGSVVNQVDVSEEIEIINTLLGSNGLMNGPEGYYALRKKFS